MDTGSVSIRLESDSSSISWFGSLQFKLLLAFCGLILATAFSITTIFDRSSKKLELVQTRDFAIAEGNSVANQLGQRVVFSQVMLEVVGGIAEVMPHDEEMHKFVVPRIMRPGDPNSVIAGGGIWPEPYAFDPDKEKSSFFWRREEDGTLTFYDEFNLVDGPGYHQKEWYVAAKHVTREKPYWSRAYIDPVTGDLLSTVAFPYLDDNGSIEGVATVDVSLTDLSKLLETDSNYESGYMFMVDGANNLVSYPKPQWLLDPDNESEPATTYINIEELSELQEFSKPYSESLASYRNNKAASIRENREALSLAQALVVESDEIDMQYALQIAEDIFDKRDAQLRWEESAHISDFVVESDGIVDDVTVSALIEIPNSNWVLAVAIPLNRSLAGMAMLESDLLLSFLSLFLLMLLAAFFCAQQIVVAPIKKIIKQLEEIESDPEHHYRSLAHTGRDELGLLVTSFNHRTETMEEARKQTEQALQTKKEFLANMSHEIRTPMNGILLSSELLSEHQLEQEPKQFAETIHCSSQALLSIINDILDFSKIESGNLILEEVPFNISKFFDDISILLSHSAEQKGVSLKFNIDVEKSAFYIGDETRLRQVVLNLVGNAVKFTSEGEVVVTAQWLSSDELMTIKVSDTGIGIPENQVTRIFDGFSQADTSITRRFGGTGLGLSISKQLIESMNGRISVQSELNKGSTFSIKLPMRKATASEYNSVVCAESVALWPSGLTGKVLLVEDNAVNQMLGKKTLEKIGLTVETAENGSVGVSRLNSDHYDLVLMDIQMPIMDGITATKIIRSADQDYKDIPIIAVSANVSVQVKQECQEVGINGFVSKPFNIQALSNELRPFLN